MHSLQVSFFITLGRIFDGGSDEFNVTILIKAIVTHSEYFTKSALAKRRKEDDTKQDWLDEFVSRAFEPQALDLRKLKKSFKPYDAKYVSVYKELRNYVYAHNIAIDDDNKSKLFSKTTTADIEDVLSYLYKLILALFDLYYNDR